MENQKNTELLIVRKLLDRMNKKILYVHWKSNQHFADALLGVDDLDILIDRKQYNELLTILSELKFKHFYIPDVRSYVGVEDYLGFDEESGIIVHLHLHSHLTVGEDHLKGYLLPIEDIILNRRAWNSTYNVFFPQPFDELLLLIIRMGMKNRKRDFIHASSLDKKTIAEFNWLKENCPDFAIRLNEESWINETVKDSILKIYHEGFKNSSLRKLKYDLYKYYSCYSQGGRIYNTFKRNWRELCRIVLEIEKRYLHTKYPLLRRRVCTGGITVSFIGSDGAGKSTNIEEIRKWLLKVMDVRYFYLGSGDGDNSLFVTVLKKAEFVGKKLGMLKAANNSYDSSLKKIQSDTKKIGFARKLWVYALASERIKKLKVANRCRLRGYVVLTDRYPQSEYTGLCDGPKMQGENGYIAEIEAEAFRIAKLCPPDLCIKLIVSPEVAMCRKPGEIDYETSKNLTERVRAIKFSEYTKSVEINADRSRDEVLLEIKRAIWSSL